MLRDPRIIDADTKDRSFVQGVTVGLLPIVAFIID